jgi:hypothetical protein
MKLLRITLPMYAVALLLIAGTAAAQDTDKAKLIEIEKAFAANPTPGQQAGALATQYLYDGPLNQLTQMGRVGTLPKARVVELFAAPDPSDPDVKTTQTIADFHVDISGTTAVVSYKLNTTDKGHKEAALDITLHLSCLDTFTKKNGTWFLLASGCASSVPIPQAVWDASKKALSQEPKDIQQSYH